MIKIVIDTNIWVRGLLAGRTAIPVLEAWREGRFQVIASETLIEELIQVCQRPRFQNRINPKHVEVLRDQIHWRGIMVLGTVAVPDCRDPKDCPVLAAAIDGHADAIVSSDGDLRADEKLASAMEVYGIKIWGVDRLLAELSSVMGCNQTAAV